jgi:hypothetical protein
MKKQKPETASDDADDAPLTAEELATARPLREALPELAAWGQRQRAKKGQKTLD